MVSSAVGSARGVGADAVVGAIGAVGVLPVGTTRIATRATTATSTPTAAAAIRRRERRGAGLENLVSPTRTVLLPVVRSAAPGRRGHSPGRAEHTDRPGYQQGAEQRPGPAPGRG